MLDPLAVLVDELGDGAVLVDRRHQLDLRAADRGSADREHRLTAVTAPDGGLYNVYADGGRPAAVTADLGQRWELEQIALRLWPSASSTQGMNTALFDLVEFIVHGNAERLKRARRRMNLVRLRAHHPADDLGECLRADNADGRVVTTMSRSAQATKKYSCFRRSSRP